MRITNRKAYFALASLLAMTAAASVAQAKHETTVEPSPGRQTAGTQIQWQSDVQSATDQAARENKLVLVDVGASWCGWCQKMDQTTYADQSVSKLLAKDFICVKLDADSDAGGKFAAKFNIQGLPSVVIMNPKAKTFKVRTGYLNPPDFVAMVTQVEQQLIAIAQ